ncbi:MAG: hypothetical protein H7Y17_03175 [Chlorobia bacterium]|nr:hypothetical protein [Fimbriimonadaceae bacterium]
MAYIDHFRATDEDVDGETHNGVAFKIATNIVYKATVIDWTTSFRSVGLAFGEKVIITQSMEYEREFQFTTPGAQHIIDTDKEEWFMFGYEGCKPSPKVLTPSNDFVEITFQDGQNHTTIKFERVI